MKTSRRRTIAQYVRLFRNPRALFSGGPDNTGADVILWPNGKAEIWITDETGKGFRIVAGRGPHGLGLQISRFIGAPAMTISANGNGAAQLAGFDATDLELCQYDDNETAQAFKAWYGRAR